MNRKEKRKIILQKYFSNVHGRSPTVEFNNPKHAGAEGHWLETQMGLIINNKNEPDLLDHEMKNHTTSKTTFGDWTASYYIFKNSKYKISRSNFFKLFGHPNKDKNNRYSWSGVVCPSYFNELTTNGQKLTIDSNSNIVITYDFSKDERTNKKKLIPVLLQRNDLIIAYWKKETMKKLIENKFNKEGWFKCKQNSNGIYSSIIFGDPIDFDKFIELFKKKKIFFDSGMYDGNIRPYSMWRANNSLWDSLVVSKHLNIYA